MTRRYQVFIASTFHDLAVERKAAIEAVLSAGHIPVAVEGFSIADEPGLEIIKGALRECQIFILIMVRDTGRWCPGLR